MRPIRLPLALLSVALGAALVIVAACGATDLEAPPAVTTTSQGNLQKCKSFDALMPAFEDAVKSGGTEPLAEVIRTSLTQPGANGASPPASDLLRAIFGTLSNWAKLPPERGAPDGQLCVVNLPDGGPIPPGAALTMDAGLPPLDKSNPMCELRRSMDAMVHAGRANDALVLVDPQIAGALNYIIGRDRRDPSINVTPHYEVAQVVSDMCRQDAVCQTSDTMDLLIGLTAWLQTDQGKSSFSRIQTLVQDPALEPYLTAASGGDGGQPALGGEPGVVALANTLLTSILGMQNPSDLDALVNNPPLSQMPSQLKSEVTAVLGDTKLMLDPNRQPNVLKPLKKVINCYKVHDSDPAGNYKGDLVLMIYRLGLTEKLPEFGLTRLMGTVNGLMGVDQRGTLVNLAHTVAVATRNDEPAMDDLGAVCNVLLSTRTQPGQSKSNAENALPVVADLFQKGIAAQAICTIDTLVYGCSGGAQPACELKDGGQ